MIELLAEALAGVACAVVCRDPLDGAHHRVGSYAYPTCVVDVLSTDFVSGSWFHTVLTGPLPASISTEPGHSFRSGWIYEQHLEPAGFRDGMSGALRRNGRYVGLVHVSSSDGRFDGEAQQTLQAVLPVLAAIADPFAPAHRALGPAVDEQGRAAVVRGGEVLEVLEQTRPLALADARLRHVVEDFAASAGRRLRMPWPGERGWARLVLSAQPDLGILVDERTCEAPYGLTDREIDVLTRLAMGIANQPIASELQVSVRTVHSHVEHIIGKLEVQSRAEACGVAVREGLVQPVPGMLLRRGVRCFVER